LETNIARTFTALSATNEAILYAKSPEQLYRQVCEAAFSSGDFLATAIFLLEPGTDKLRFAAGFGDDIKRLCAIDISIAADTLEGLGVCGQAFRDQKICISNDYLNDIRSLAWPKGATEALIGAAAALPLTCSGRGVGALLVTSATLDRSTNRSFHFSIGCRRTFRMRSTISSTRTRAKRRAGPARTEPNVRRYQRHQRSHSSRQDRTGALPARL